MCQRCVDALAETFPGVPDNEVGNFLMNCTIFPFGEPEIVAKQLQDLRAKTDNYLECYGIVEAEMMAAMARYKEEHPD